MSLDAWRRYRTNLDWVEELLYLTVLATEACMVYPWQLLISTWLGYEAMPLWALCVLFWVPYLITTLLSHSRLPRDRRQALVAGLMLLTALIVVRLYVYGGRNLPGPTFRYPVWDPSWIADMVDSLVAFDQLVPVDLLAVILVFIGWWRGIVASRKEYDTQQVWFRFRLGVVDLAGFFFLTIFGRHLDLTALIFAYFFCGLLSIALSSILEQGGISQSTLGSRQWVAVLAGAILGNLGLALLVSLLFSRQALRTVFSWLRPIGFLLRQMVWHLLAALLYLLWPLLDWALAWLQQVQSEGLMFELSPLMSPLASPEEIMRSEEGLRWMPYCNTILVVLLVVGALVLIVRTIRGLSEAQDRRRDIERESVWSDQDLAGDLRNSLRQGWDRIVALAGQLGGRHRRSAASIRKMYASMVDLATEGGYARRPAETPYEYLGSLYQAYPEGQEAVEAITEAYVRVHYGEVPGTRAEMERLVGYWEQLQHVAESRPPQREI